MLLDTLSSLIQMFPESASNSSILLSEYVCKLVRLKADRDFIHMAYSFSMGNNSWKGWVFEIDFHSQVVGSIKYNRPFVISKLSNKLFFRREIDYGIQISRLCDYDGITIDDTLLNADPCMFACTKVNQGCFDFIYHYMIGSFHHFIFFQCAVSLKHKYKMEYINKFLYQCFPDALNYPVVSTRRRGPSVSSVRIKVHFYVVTPYRNMLNFIVSSNDVENLNAVTVYDPSFEIKRIKITDLNSL